MRKACRNMTRVASSAIISALEKNKARAGGMRRSRIDPAISDQDGRISRHTKQLSGVLKGGWIRFALAQGIPSHHDIEKSKKAHLIKQCSA